jgi:hypothetical protein
LLDEEAPAVRHLTLRLLLDRPYHDYHWARLACVANAGQPCAWGAIKAMSAFARIPTVARSPLVERAIQQGIAFLLSCDPATALYPMGYGNTRPSGLWFKLGFPSAYVADVLQNLEVLGEFGYAADSRVQPALEWLVSKQDAQGPWRNEYAHNGKTWVDFEPDGQPSKWVTLRACHVLKLALGTPDLRREGFER